MVTMLLLVVFATSGLLYVAYRAAGSKTQKGTAPEAAKAGGVMSEEERLAYITANVTVNDLVVGPDQMPDRPEPVPGLLRVSGIVVNKGAAKLDRIHLAIYPKDAGGKVLGSYIENIAGKEGLDAGASRPFKFQIPEKKEFSGLFDHKLR
jgi:hypothetical protein